MNTHYKLYIKSILQLIATLVIKDEYTANSLNEYLEIRGYKVDRDDPYTWKYYLNLSGRYHESDTVMRITSVDTLEEIDLTIENLAVHRGTRRELTYGSNLYRELLAKYPNQRQLLNSIINPVDVKEAIEAPDHKILFFDKNLVEESEQQLIPGLQEYIYKFFFRWYNRDFPLYEPYYYPALLSSLYGKLPQQVILLRKQACRTDQAHSYHIRQYLSSFSSIGQEIDYMTLKQKLWLYRNIRFLMRNIGQQEIFEKVVQRILTDRGFSLVGYDLRQRYEEITTKLVPEVMLQRKPINHIAPAQGGEFQTVETILKLQDEQARDNAVNRGFAEKNVNLFMGKSLFGDLPTKVLESNVADRADSEVYTMSDITLNHWIYFSHLGLYNTFIKFTNPSNGETYRLEAKNAFLLYLYLYNKAINVELEYLPKVRVTRVVRLPPPTFEELRSITTTDRVSDKYIQKILSDQVDIQPMVSTDAFRETCSKIQRTMLNLRMMRHFNNDYRSEGQLHVAIDRCYMTTEIDMGKEVRYDDWISSLGINLEGMGRIEFESIAAEILTNATGADLSVTNSIREVHAAMMRIMRALSDYTVQYLTQINDGAIKVIDGKFPKLGDVLSDETTYTTVENIYPDVQKLYSNNRLFNKMEVVQPKIDSMGSLDASESRVPVDVKISLKTEGIGFAPVSVAMPVVRTIEPDVIDLTGIREIIDDAYDVFGHSSIFDLVKDNNLTGYEMMTEARRRMFLNI